MLPKLVTVNSIMFVADTIVFEAVGNFLWYEAPFKTKISEMYPISISDVRYLYRTSNIQYLTLATRARARARGYDRDIRYLKYVSDV